MSGERGRRWFVALAWATLVGFAIFVAGITAAAIAIPQMRRAGGGGSWEHSGTVETRAR
jgi:hypothetical protein